MHKSALDLGARFVQTQILGLRRAPDGHQHVLGPQRLRLAGLVAEGHGRAVARLFHRLHFGLGENLDARLRKTFSSSAEISSSSSGTMRGSISSNVTCVPKERKIEANSTPTAPAPTITSDLGTSGKFRISRLLRITLAVELDARQRARLRAGREHDVRGFDLGDLAVGLHRHAARARPAAPALHRLHFIFAEEKLDALGVLVDDVVLARQHGRPVQLELGHFDAELLGVLEGVVDFGVVQQNLGGDAADVQAGPAQKAVFFDDQGFQSPLRGADGGHVSARPAADNRQIVIWQEQPPRHPAARIKIPTEKAQCQSRRVARPMRGHMQRNVR